MGAQVRARRLAPAGCAVAAGKQRRIVRYDARWRQTGIRWQRVSHKHIRVRTAVGMHERDPRWEQDPRRARR